MRCIREDCRQDSHETAERAFALSHGCRMCASFEDEESGFSGPQACGERKRLRYLQLIDNTKDSDR